MKYLLIYFCICDYLDEIIIYMSFPVRYNTFLSWLFVLAALDKFLNAFKITYILKRMVNFI